MGPRNMSRRSRIRVLKYFYTVVGDRWLKVLKKNPSISVFAFVKYYIKLLILKGFDADSSLSPRLHTSGTKSNVALFLRSLDESLYF